MIRADLHMHTQASDGIDSAETLIQRCVERGLDVIAITDHDLSPDMDRIRKAAAGYPIEVLVGMECGTKDPASGKSAHIIAYDVKDYTELDELMEPVLVRRNMHTLHALYKVSEMGYDLTEEYLRSFTYGKYLYRQHVIYGMYMKGYIPELWGDWYREMFKKGGVLSSKNHYPRPEEIVQAIVRAGGKAVLAHPGQQQNFDLLPKLKKHGLFGVELIHPSNSEADRKIIRDMGTELELFFTGGSDYHGILSSSGAEIGESYIIYESREELLLDKENHQ